MIKQPNGKYMDKSRWSTRGQYNLTKEEFIEMQINCLKENLERQFEEADQKGIGEISEVVKGMIDDNQSLLFITNFLDEIGFEDSIAALHNIELEVGSDGYSNHDACSYARCPMCGNSITSWSSKCSCGQKYKIK